MAKSALDLCWDMARQAPVIALDGLLQLTVSVKASEPLNPRELQKSAMRAEIAETLPRMPATFNRMWPELNVSSVGSRL